MVNTSKNDLEDFDIKKIENSLMRETGLDWETARYISIEVVRQLIESNAKILTSPEIRELTCATLMRKGYHKERFLYTRLGFPLSDFIELERRDIKKREKQIKAYLRLKSEAREVMKIVERLDK
jgi:anaerobic ribonucleoside-triphosphate reductase